MLNYYELILDMLNESEKSIKDLEENKILGKNTFYTFKETAPSLKVIVRICNFLKVSIDYLLDKSDENKFKPYALEQTSFYNNLEKLRTSLNISQSKLCKDLEISRTNLSRWKNGTNPTMANLIILANYLNCNIDDLLEHE